MAAASYVRTPTKNINETLTLAVKIGVLFHFLGSLLLAGAVPVPKSKALGGYVNDKGCWITIVIIIITTTPLK